MQGTRPMHRLLFTFLVLLAAREAAACSCIAGGTVEQAYTQADAVFAGVAVSIDDPRDQMRNLPEHEQLAHPRVPSHLDPDWGRRITFRVLQWWKTEAFAESVTLRTGYGGGDCGYPVEAGKSYLVFARRNSRNDLVFGICGKTAALLCASPALAELGDPIKTYERFDVQSLPQREQPYTTYWRPCIKPPVLIGARELRMDKHCHFQVSGVIATDGTVRDFRIASRTVLTRCPESLDDHVRARVAQWRFRPAEFEGKPIETLLTAVSIRNPMTESEYAKQLQEQAEWEAKHKPK